jgi:UPF0176 protein
MIHSKRIFGVNDMMVNIAGYKFIPLVSLPHWREQFTLLCQQTSLQGTILLSPEGININLAGTSSDVQQFQVELRQFAPFADIHFHVTPAHTTPFNKLKVKIKKEIITFKQTYLHPAHQKAPAISPHELKQWLDEQKPMTLLDTRNTYEIAYGSFTQASHLHLNHFTDFANAVEVIPQNKPIVMFCTGGIRCEKAALYLLEQGFNEVYQLQGGILGYFAQVGKAHYSGDCFVFDNRIKL